jgi:hypothetical protein
MSFEHHESAPMAKAEFYWIRSGARNLFSSSTPCEMVDRLNMRRALDGTPAGERRKGQPGHLALPSYSAVLQFGLCSATSESAFKYQRRLVVLLACPAEEGLIGHLGKGA